MKIRRSQSNKEHSNKKQTKTILRYGARLRQNIREMRENAPFGKARLTEENKESKR